MRSEQQQAHDRGKQDEVFHRGLCRYCATRHRARLDRGQTGPPLPPKDALTRLAGNPFAGGCVGARGIVTLGRSTRRRSLPAGRARMTHTSIRLLGMLLLISMVSGCATLAGESTQKLNIQTVDAEGTHRRRHELSRQQCIGGLRRRHARCSTCGCGGRHRRWSLNAAATALRSRAPSWFRGPSRCNPCNCYCQAAAA